jgi:hypothetical protein
MGVLNVGLFAWFILIMLNFSTTYVYPAATVELIVRLYWLAIPLTIGVLLLAIRAWRHREIHWGWRVHYSAVAAAGMVFLWFLYSWNLLAGL